jgi:hypothetical protein
MYYSLLHIESTCVFKSSETPSTPSLCFFFFLEKMSIGYGAFLCFTISYHGQPAVSNFSYMSSEFDGFDV